ncbi:LytR/AlgR family response regulator transcription factor [Fluviicola taffensis]|uniref:Two component transcriptional regulator, LytTR family n=1 Tax=Fluviicola taffensis (strain DSM 16823 / NCIMB 13979 / RW262) TaxID=755732 RepID=F2IIW0_FLUTR|nr:LytTR family DNA-binding domain-containing protein [Fluviicola taffensis]AEA42817.1 two component transcriptional regulator, LytTR family [Fluviicola taffensis DSM 16823]
MKVLILDDIRISREGLAALLNKIDPSIEIAASVATLEEAKQAFDEKTIDVAFLDIQLQSGTSFDLVDEIPFETKVVFITAYDEHAISAIRKGAFDYLLKPINSADLRNCIQRIYDVDSQTSESIETTQTKTDDPLINQDIIGITGIDAITFLKIEDILYLKADGKYTMIQTTKEHITSSKNLKVFENMLPESKFMRVHHSFLLNLKFITKYQKEYNTLVLENGAQIPVSKSRKELLMQRLMHV